MFTPIFLALAIAFLFYFLVPILGAFVVRSQWTGFRRGLIGLGFYPILGYEAVRACREGRAGRFRLFGVVEAIEGDSRILVRGDGITAAVDVAGADVHWLPPDRPDGDWPAVAQDSVARMAWSDVESLPESVRVLVGGEVVVELGLPCFKSFSGDPLVLVFYEGRDETALYRATRYGRHRNEYWNPLTQYSLVGGILGMVFLVLSGPPASSIALIRALVLVTALMPVLPLIPPGLGFFFVYRRAWARALEYRASRDCLRLLSRFFPSGGDSVELPGGVRYRRVPVGKDQIREARSFAEELKAFPKRAKRAVNYLYCDLDGGGRPVAPKDPGLAFATLEGDPEELAKACQRLAKRNQRLAGLAFAGGLFLNFWLGFVLLRAYFI